MKKMKLNHLLRTSVFTVLLTSIMGVSACSNSEKEDVNTQSGDTTGVNQDQEVKEYAQSDAPTSTDDTNLGSGEDSSASTSNGMGTVDQPGSTDNMDNSEPDNNANENSNPDQTAADGLQ